MTREEIIEAIQNDDMMPFLQDWQARDVVDFVLKNIQPSLPDGLEEAAWDCVLDSVDVNNPVLLPKYKELLTYLFIAGAEWQRKQDQSLIELAEDHAMLAGMNKMEEQILEDAIEIEVKEDAGGFPIVPLDAIELYDYENDKPLAKDGDKVRVIIIKDDK